MRSVLILTLALVAAASAQEVASRDLTNPNPVSTFKDRAAEQRERCGERVRGVVGDGVIVPKTGTPPDEFELRITHVEPVPLTYGAEFFVTVRLRNAGKALVAIPWEPDPGKIRDTEASDERGFHAAWVGFDVHGNGYSQRLPSGFTLYASDDKAWSFVKLNPGEWVTLKIRTALRCPNDDPSCKSTGAQGPVQLEAYWTRIFQQIKTSGCRLDESTYQNGHTTSAPAWVTIVDVPIS